MNKIKNRILKRLSEQKGASNTIELVFIILLLFAVAITIIDVGIYFNNRYVITNSAQNGARLVAVFGGTGNTNVAQAYGITDVTPECQSFHLDNAVECYVYNDLKNSTGTVSTVIKKIDCGPTSTNVIGERVWCEVEYDYLGLPGSGLSFIQMYGTSRVRMTAESEVLNR